MKTIRACFVTPRSGITGVWSDLYAGMFKYAREAGIEPVLIHRSNASGGASLRQGVEEVVVRSRDRTVQSFGPLSYLSWWVDDYSYSLRVAEAAKELNVDLFHLLSSVTGRVLKSKGIRRPLVMFGWSSAAIGQTSLDLKARILVDYVEVPVERLLVTSVDHVVCVTEPVRSFYLRMMPPRKLSVVPGGVDVDLFRPDRADPSLAAEYGLEGQFTIVSVGRIIPVKGFDILLEAVARLCRQLGPEKVRLLIVGSPSELWAHAGGSNPYFSRLKDYVSTNGLGGVVTFTGPLPHSTLSRLLPLADVFVLASRAEGLGLVILEAMASGLPVVGSRVGGIPEVVEGNNVGFTFPAGDSAALKERLLELYGDRAFGREIGARGRRVAEARYSWRQIMSSLYEVYARVLGETSR